MYGDVNKEAAPNIGGYRRKLSRTAGYCRKLPKSVGNCRRLPVSALCVRRCCRAPLDNDMSLTEAVTKVGEGARAVICRATRIGV
jgi:hypothetical protein